MAYIEFITGTENVEVKFNDLQNLPNIAMVKAAFNRHEILAVWHSTFGYVSVKFIDNNEWYFNLTGADNYLPVSLIDGVTPTSLDDLYNYFKGLIK